VAQAASAAEAGAGTLVQRVASATTGRRASRRRRDVAQTQPEALIALKKSLGLFRLTVYGVGIIVGAGIDSVIGPAAAKAGAGISLSFVLAAVISGFSAVSYPELASALSSKGHRAQRCARLVPEPFPS